MELVMELIKEHGSISQATKAMHMSYRITWLLIDELNEVAGQPVMITQKGEQRELERKYRLMVKN